MIEILQRDNYSQVQDESLKAYLTYSFQRLPKDFHYPKHGYFIIIEAFQELEVPLQLTYCSLPSILYTQFLDYVELVEEKDGVIEIVLILHNDFGVSLMMRKDILSEKLYEQLQLYKLQGTSQ